MNRRETDETTMGGRPGPTRMSEPKNELEQIESLESQVSDLVSRLDEACGRVTREMSDNDADWIEETEDAIERLADATGAAPESEPEVHADAPPEDEPDPAATLEQDPESLAGNEPEAGLSDPDTDADGDAVAEMGDEPAQVVTDQEGARAEPVVDDEPAAQPVAQTLTQSAAHDDPVVEDSADAESGDLASAVDEALAALTTDDPAEEIAAEVSESAADDEPDLVAADPVAAEPVATEPDKPEPEMSEPGGAVDEDQPAWDSPRATAPAPLDASYSPDPDGAEPEVGGSVADAAPEDAEPEDPHPKDTVPGTELSDATETAAGDEAFEQAVGSDGPGADAEPAAQPEGDAVVANSAQDEFAAAMASVLSDLGLDEDLPQDYSDLPEGIVEGYVEPESEVSEVAPDENLDDDPEAGEDDGPDLGPAESAAAMGPDELDAELARLAEDLIEKTPEAPPPDEAVVGVGAPDVNAESPAPEEPARTPEPEKVARSAGGKKTKPKSQPKPKPSTTGKGSGVWERVRPPLIAALALVAPWLAKGLLSAAKPLESKPPVWRDTIGLIAVYSVFLATSVLIWAAFFRPDEIPVVIIKPPELAAPEAADPGPTAVPADDAP